MKPRHLKMTIAAGVLVGSGLMAALVFNAFQSNLVFFYSPSQVDAKEAPLDRTFRIGGLVQEGSVQREGVMVNFVVTDTANAVTVRYSGILPDLFKEGKGVVAQGRLEDGVFMAREVLAKHDENYMPPEAADAVAKAHQAQARSENTLIPSTVQGAEPKSGYGAGSSYGTGARP